MPAVGELVRCIDGSCMTRPQHARNGEADAPRPPLPARVIPNRLPRRLLPLPGAGERIVFERNQIAVPASGRGSMTWAFDLRS
jgi:hypothetical protein